jgi:hypothetical protein
MTGYVDVGAGKRGGRVSLTLACFAGCRKRPHQQHHDLLRTHHRRGAGSYNGSVPPTWPVMASLLTARPKNSTSCQIHFCDCRWRLLLSRTKLKYSVVRQEKMETASNSSRALLRPSFFLYPYLIKEIRYDKKRNSPMLYSLTARRVAKPNKEKTT